MPRIAKWKRETGDDIYGKMGRKYRYYSALSALDEVLCESQTIYFRKIVSATSTALFRGILDRIMVFGYLERLTVEMSQRDQVWGASELTKDDVDAVQMSEALKGIVYRMSTQDVDVIFLRLNEHKQIDVTAVIKSRIGPYIHPTITPEPRFLPLKEIAGAGSLLNVSSPVRYDHFFCGTEEAGISQSMGMAARPSTFRHASATLRAEAIRFSILATSRTRTRHRPNIVAPKSITAPPTQTETSGANNAPARMRIMDSRGRRAGEVGPNRK